MKIKILCASLVLLSFNIFAQGPYAPPVGQTGTKAIYKDSSIIVTWASACTITRGPQDISGSTGSGNASVGTNVSATGLSGQNGVVSLGDGGSATLTFNAPIINGSGADFAVFENSFDGLFLELAFVEVSSDGINFYRFDAISLTDTATQTASFTNTDATNLYNLAGKYRSDYGTPFDLDELDGIPGLDVNNITHIKIIDVVGSIDPQYASYDSQNRAVNDPWPTGFGSSGFDLDAVAVINSSATTISELKNQPLLNLYPNPIKNILTININNIDRYNFSILNTNGQVITTGEFNSYTHQIDLSTLNSGVYFIQLKTEKAIVTKRIVKQ